MALAGVAQWIECQACKGSLVRFPFRARAWARHMQARSPVEGAQEANHTLMFLSLSFFLPSPLSKNK